MPRRRRRARATGLDAVIAVVRRVYGPAGHGWDPDDDIAYGLLAYVSPTGMPRSRIVVDVVARSVSVYRGRRLTWVQPHPDPDLIAAELTKATS